MTTTGRNKHKQDSYSSVDPLAEKYYSISPYAYCADDPVNYTDPDGKYIQFWIRDSQDNIKAVYNYHNGNFYKNGVRYNPSKEHVSTTMYRVLASYRRILASGKETLINQLHFLENSELVHIMEAMPKEREGEGSGVSSYQSSIHGTHTLWDFLEKAYGRFEKTEKVKETDMANIAHEMSHEVDNALDNNTDNSHQPNKNNPAEIRAVHNENEGRKIDGSEQRTTYGGETIKLNLLNSPPNNKQPQ